MKKTLNIETLKDMVNVKFEEYKDKVAFLEKSSETRNWEEIKYSQLKEEINALGTVMLKNFDLEGEKVAVIGPNSNKWYITYMATVCGVGVIVPLDKELPKEEILNLLKRSKAKAVVYSNTKSDIILGLRDKLPKDMIYIDMNKKESDDTSYSFNELVSKGKELVDTGEVEYIDKKIDRNEFSVLLYTSGTTAAAKGVMLCHRNLVSNLEACMDILPDTKKFRYFSILPMHHTYEFMISYLNPTSVGASVIICEGLKYIQKNMQETHPTVLVAVPLLLEKFSKGIDKKIKETNKENLISTMGMITGGLSKIGIDLKRVVFKKIHETFGGNLKYIFCGAAPLDKKITEKLEAYGFIILQGYGLTETSPLVAGTRPERRKAGTVGDPVKGVEVRIDLQENENFGEILVKGDNVMLGYYENDTETNKVLRKGWFHTGDVGYFDEQGNLVVSGRIKNVIVTQNGKNIFPEEIEFLINKIPLVSESMIYGAESLKEDEEEELIVTARVKLDEEYIEEFYGGQRPTDDEFHEIIWEQIKKINRTMVPYKAVKKLEIKKGDFPKTTTMKIKRFEELKTK